VHSVYDPATNAWSSGPFLPEPRSGGAAVLYHDRILLMGGECNAGKPFAQNEAYDPKTMKWTPLAPMPLDDTGSMPCRTVRRCTSPAAVRTVAVARRRR
jgi:hypothetical protein